MFIDFIKKLSNILTESDDDFSHGHFEQKNFVLSQKLMEKGQLILQLWTPPHLLIPTSTVIREMRVTRLFAK